MTRWTKVFRDLSINKMRTFFAVLAIFIGVFGISTVADSYSILLREMDRNYINTSPASATLTTSAISDAEMKRIIDLPYIKDAERRGRIIGRVEVGENEWKDIWLFIINDFKDVRLDTFTPEKGKAVPDTGEILLERKALALARADLGQTLNIRIPGGSTAGLKFTGTVHAPGLAPAWMEGHAYGFISQDTLKLLGGGSTGTELKIAVSEAAMNRQHIRDDANMLKSFLEKDGVAVSQIEVPQPGRHPHYDQMAALLFLMEIFGLLALVLSGVLAANIISAILEQQTRQIGIMKAIGASSPQIASLYGGMVVIFALAAILAGIPAGVSAGRGYAVLAAGILNFRIYDNSIPAFIFAVEATTGLVVPLLSAAWPVFRGSRVTVQEAINDYGISQKKYSGRKAAAKPAQAHITRFLRVLPRPFLMSVRNTFRRKGRLIFTMLVMAAGGTGFIVALNIYASMYNTVEKKVNSIAYDIQVTFDHPQQAEIIEKVIEEIPGTAKAEAWGGAFASRIHRDGSFGNGFGIVAPPAATSLMTAPPLYKGRWLDAGDTDAIVINQRILSDEPDIEVGDELLLRIGQTETKWRVAGISNELAGRPTAYVNYEYLSRIMKTEGLAMNAAVVLDEHGSAAAQIPAEKLIEEKMAESGHQISSLIKIADFRKSIEDHLVVIATFLIIMSLLVVLVGGLGLATTVSINTMERTREIGVMRSMGASAHSVTGIIVSEGVIIGILSWFVSLILSWPVSRFVSRSFGLIFFKAPLEFAFSIPGIVIWLLIVILFAALSSFYPSRKALQMPVRDALSYE
ncbi:MAG TPA: FtsX-like permease family protein [Clostridia bacterium]|nr:FtsX-like permease family protein [Clostridia bacterium]